MQVIQAVELQGWQRGFRSNFIPRLQPSQPFGDPRDIAIAQGMIATSSIA
jgi:hypothetical protein